MRREDFIRAALLIARRATAWAHDAATSLPDRDMTRDAWTRFEADIQEAVEFGRRHSAEAPKPEETT